MYTLPICLISYLPEIGSARVWYPTGEDGGGGGGGGGEGEGGGGGQLTVNRRY